MSQSTLKIAKTTKVENPLPETEWFETYKIGSRVPKIQANVDMYHSKEYDFDKLVNIIKYGTTKPGSWYERIILWVKTA